MYFLGIENLKIPIVHVLQCIILMGAPTLGFKVAQKGILTTIRVRVMIKKEAIMERTIVDVL